jgi:hypothetical protein
MGGAGGWRQRTGMDFRSVDFQILDRLDPTDLRPSHTRCADDRTISIPVGYKVIGYVETSFGPNPKYHRATTTRGNAKLKPPSSIQQAVALSLSLQLPITHFTLH